MDVDGVDGVANLTLNVRVTDLTGSDYVGETPPELAVINFGNVPEGVFFRANMGGSFTGNYGMDGIVVFRGTQEEANEIDLVATGVVVALSMEEITIVSYTVDGADDSMAD